MNRRLTALLLGAAIAAGAVGCAAEETPPRDAGAPAEVSGENLPGGGENLPGGDEAPVGAGDGPDLPGVLDYQDCLEVSLTYASIYLSALGFQSEADRAALQQSIDEVKGQVPAEIRDDLQTIADGVNNADGVIALGEFFDSPEYKQADDNITAYLDQTCGADMGGVPGQ